jgi:hypothetical protein
MDVPLFVARPRLYRTGKAAIKTFPRARGRWAMDSGGFWEVAHRGGWTISPALYVEQVRRARDEIGNMDWAAPMDWMCEDEAIKATGLSVVRHQELTIDNGIDLRMRAADLPFIYVIQGKALNDYRRCVEMYTERGVDLAAEPVVGLGSVCRREDSLEIQMIARTIHEEYGISLHGFGVKKGGLERYAEHLRSSDSLAWSARGYHVMPCAHPRPGRPPAQSEANCSVFALQWRDQLLSRLT